MSNENCGKRIVTHGLRATRISEPHQRVANQQLELPSYITIVVHRNNIRYS